MQGPGIAVLREPDTPITRKRACDSRSRAKLSISSEAKPSFYQVSDWNSRAKHPGAKQQHVQPTLSLVAAPAHPFIATNFLPTTSIQDRAPSEFGPRVPSPSALIRVTWLRCAEWVPSVLQPAPFSTRLRLARQRSDCILDILLTSL